MPDELFTARFYIIGGARREWEYRALENQLAMWEKYFADAETQVARANSLESVFTEEEEEMLSRAQVPCAGPGCDRLFDRSDRLVMELTRKGATPATIDGADAYTETPSDKLRCLAPGCNKRIDKDWFEKARVEARLIWQVAPHPNTVLIPLRTEWVIAQMRRANPQTVEDEADEPVEAEPAAPADVVIGADAHSGEPANPPQQRTRRRARKKSTPRDSSIGYRVDRQ